MLPIWWKTGQYEVDFNYRRQRLHRRGNYKWLVKSLQVLFFPDSVSDTTEWCLFPIDDAYAYMCSWRLRKTDIAVDVDIICA